LEDAEKVSLATRNWTRWMSNAGTVADHLSDH
jgi:hypothetical protein